MNGLMLRKFKRVDDAREELGRALEDLRTVCDHRDEFGEKRVSAQDYEGREVEDELLFFCAFCGKEI